MLISDRVLLESQWKLGSLVGIIVLQQWMSTLRSCIGYVTGYTFIASRPKHGGRSKPAWCLMKPLQTRYRRSSCLPPVSCPERLHQTFFQPVTSLDQTFSSLSPTCRHSAPFLGSDAPLLTHTPTQPQTLPRGTLVVEVVEVGRLVTQDRLS